MRSSVLRWAGPAAIAGGFLWVALRPLVSSTWESTVLGLGYLAYNRLMVIPLLLLLAGAAGLGLPSSSGRLGRSGWAFLTLGLAMSLAGVMVEFWWAGGLGENRQGAMLGWGVYGLGLLGQAAGLALIGANMLRTRNGPYWVGVVPLAMAALVLLWFPLLAMGLGGWSILDQVLYGLGWVALGYVSWSRKGAERRA